MKPYIVVDADMLELARSDFKQYMETGDSKFRFRYVLLKNAEDEQTYLGLTELYAPWAYALREAEGTLDQEPRLKVFKTFEGRFAL